MNITQRYNMQKRSRLRDLGIDTFDSVLSNTSSAEGAIDKYIIAMIETKDNRRLLLDKSEYNNILDAYAKDVCKRIEKEIDRIFI